MCPFKVGTRVKLARPWFPKNLGITGEIKFIGDIDKYAMSRGFSRFLHTGDCVVLWDRGPLPEGTGNPQFLNQLEPILSDREPSKMSFQELMEDLNKVMEVV